MTLKKSFPPVAAADARVLILGSLPGDASLAAGQYYAHPRNQFWRLVGEVAGVALAERNYPARLAALQQARIALWDVVNEAHRPGSLDMAIRNARPNDLLALVDTLPELRAVGFNGTTAAKAGRLLEGRGLALLELPSSSPANTMAYADKLAAWRGLGKWLAQ